MIIDMLTSLYCHLFASRYMTRTGQVQDCFSARALAPWIRKVVYWVRDPARLWLATARFEVVKTCQNITYTVKTCSVFRIFSLPGTIVCFCPPVSTLPDCLSILERQRGAAQMEQDGVGEWKLRLAIQGIFHKIMVQTKIAPSKPLDCPSLWQTFRRPMDWDSFFWTSFRDIDS